MMWILPAAGILLCLCCSAFFSSTEITYSACNTVRLENARDEGNKRAAAAVKITERFDDALGAILIGNNLANIASSALASVLVIMISGVEEYTWVATVIITILVIIFGETLPKIKAKKNANRLAISYAPVIRALMIILLPVIRIIVGLVKLCTLGLKGEEEEDPEEAVEELQSLIETAGDEEVLDEDRSELVQAAIDFSEISAFEVMTARVDVEAIDVDDDREEILRTVREARFSRIPVYEDSIDNVIGVLYLNHFLKALTDDKNTDIRSIIMPPCFIYKTMKLPDVLSTLRRAKQHLAIVTDEYGGTLGVISMEDVLEQLVGDIWDDSDVVEQEIVRKDGGVLELDGDMMMPDFIELLELDEEDFETDSETVGGWTVENFGCYPKAGESIELEGLRITVLEADERRVERVSVSRIKTEEEP